MQNLTGRLGFAFFFPPDKFAYVHVKQITRHEIHVFNNEMDGSFLRTLALSRVRKFWFVQISAHSHDCVKIKREMSFCCSIICALDSRNNNLGNFENNAFKTSYANGCICCEGV